MNDLLKAFLENAFKNIHGECNESWTIEDSEVALVADILNARQAYSFDDAEDVIIAHFRIDHNTRRILIKGYCVWDGAAYFAEEADAVAYLNKNGFACTSFSEAFEAAEKGEMTDCYKTDWYERNDCDAVA